MSKTGVVKFARVVFSSNKKVQILPIERIKIIKGDKYYSYLPKDKSDFIRLKYTYAAQVLEDDPEEEGQKSQDKEDKGMKIISILNLGGMYLCVCE